MSPEMAEIAIGDLLQRARERLEQAAGSPGRPGLRRDGQFRLGRPRRGLPLRHQSRISLSSVIGRSRTRLPVA